MARYLVTGGAGFIGSHIVEALVARGESVVVLDNLSTGNPENLSACQDAIEFIEGDLRDRETVRQSCESVDYVLHQGALPSVPRSIEDPIGSNEANVTGTLNVLVAAREAGVRRVVYAGSSSAYGDTPTLPKREDMATRPRSPYAVSKLAGELYCQVFHAAYGLETVVLRYFNVFGPRQDPNSPYSAVIPRFITALRDGRAPVVYGDGEQSRDFTYVANAVEANLLACEAPDAPGRVMNVACGEQTSLNTLLHNLGHIMGREVAPAYEPPRPGDVKHSLADISLARELLGYSVAVPIAEGLRETVGYFAGNLGDCVRETAEGLEKGCK